jgi:hypothetical protein
MHSLASRMLVPVDEWYKLHPDRIEHRPTEQMLDDISSGYTVYVGIWYKVGEETKYTTLLVHLNNIHHSIDQAGNRCDTYDGEISHLVDIPDSHIHGFVEQKEILLDWNHILEFDSDFI